MTCRCRMHTIKFEVLRFEGGNRERREFYLQLARNVQRMKNRVMQFWLLGHEAAGNVDAAWKYCDDYFQWERVGKHEKAAKPRHGVKALPTAKWQTQAYHDLRKRFPGVHTRLTTLLVDKLVKTIKNRKSSNFGQLPGWLAILLGLESLPTFSRPQPIDFDKANSLALFDGEANEFQIWLKCEMPGPRKPVQDVLTLKTKDRRGWKQLPVLKQLIAGKAELKGSQLAYAKGKWFVHLTVEPPQETPAEVDPNKTAVLRAGRGNPWRLRMDGRTYQRGGSGDHVGAMRQKVQRERRSRQNKSRWAPRRNKGRGRTKATASWQKLDTRWHDYCEAYNHTVSTSIVRELCNSGIGRLLLLGSIEGRFLAVAGNETGYQSSWPVFRFKTMLAYKCQRAGIEFVDRSTSRKPKGQDKDAAEPLEATPK